MPTRRPQARSSSTTVGSNGSLSRRYGAASPEASVPQALLPSIAGCPVPPATDLIPSRLPSANAEFSGLSRASRQHPGDSESGIRYSSEPFDALFCLHTLPLLPFLWQKLDLRVKHRRGTFVSGPLRGACRRHVPGDLFPTSFDSPIPHQVTSTDASHRAHLKRGREKARHQTVTARRHEMSAWGFPRGMRYGVHPDSTGRASREALCHPRPLPHALPPFPLPSLGIPSNVRLRPTADQSRGHAVREEGYAPWTRSSPRLGIKGMGGGLGDWGQFPGFLVHFNMFSHAMSMSMCVFMRIRYRGMYTYGQVMAYTLQPTILAATPKRCAPQQE